MIRLGIVGCGKVVDAFLLAARGGDFDALVAVLDPDVVLRIDAGASRPADSMAIRGAAAVAGQALTGLSTALRVAQVHPALVNGAAGVIVTVRGRAVTVMGFTGGSGHVWQTTNAGSTWIDFTGSPASVLPDSPVNAVVVDPGAHIVYVGTDVGVSRLVSGHR